MSDHSGEGFHVAHQPQGFDYSNLGTAAGTTTLANYPTVLHQVSILNPAVAGTAVIYDSVGTSGTVIGTIINAGGGTVVPQLQNLDLRTTNALSISNTANMNLLVSYIK